MTEHYWNVNSMGHLTKHKAFTETFDLDVLRWQGHAPMNEGVNGISTGDDARASGGDDVPPFIYAFVPVWWEDDFKGSNRMLSDGPNYRWQFNDFPFHRVVELWLEGPEEWQEVIARTSAAVSKPEWAQTDTFPYLRPSFNIASIFLTDIPASDNYTQYHGYITMR